MNEPVSRETLGLGPEASAALRAYGGFLATEGTKRGLIGPREVNRLWGRHIANCAVVALDDRELVPRGAWVVDVGSGGGLPGLVWAIVRPDIRVTLVESLLRRSAFLAEAVEMLELGSRVEVVRERAEALSGALDADVAVARAVAPMPRLLDLLVPLVRAGGCVLAIKGKSAQREAGEAAGSARRRGLGPAEILTCGEGLLDPPTVVVRYTKSG